jgi:hypothetical protein
MEEGFDPFLSFTSSFGAVFQAPALLSHTPRKLLNYHQIPMNLWSICLYFAPVKVELPSPSPLTKWQSTSCSTSEGSHTLDSDSSHSNSIPSKATHRHWPAHYHAIDVITFFNDVDNHPKETMEHIFSQHFPNTEFRRTTYLLRQPLIVLGNDQPHNQVRQKDAMSSLA